jgi:hypothetical protein
MSKGVCFELDFSFKPAMQDAAGVLLSYFDG